MIRRRSGRSIDGSAIDTRTITATEARVHVGETMRRVAENRETVIVERAGQPQVVILAVEDYQRSQGGDASTDDWWERAMRSRERIAEEFNGRPLPDVAGWIREGREERDAQMLTQVMR